MLEECMEPNAWLIEYNNINQHKVYIKDAGLLSVLLRTDKDVNKPIRVFENVTYGKLGVMTFCEVAPHYINDISL